MIAGRQRAWRSAGVAGDMTAFAGADFNSPEAANRRLANAMFLQERDLPLFRHMVMEIRRLQHADENIPLADELEASAWARTFAVYEQLRDRAVIEEHRVTQSNQEFAADQAEWRDYISSREEILGMLQRGVFDEDVLIDHLDVELPGDLGPPTTTETDRYGSSRHPEWRERATRLASALRWWDALGAQARSAIKQERAMRQLRVFKEERDHV